jgi:hypothetical protein
MSSSINLQPRAMRPNSEVEKLLNPKNLVHAIAGNNPQGFFEAAKKKVSSSETVTICSNSLK